MSTPSLKSQERAARLFKDWDQDSDRRRVAFEKEVLDLIGTAEAEAYERGCRDRPGHSQVTCGCVFRLNGSLKVPGTNCFTPEEIAQINLTGSEPE